jgi:hypothetical protein
MWSFDHSCIIILYTYTKFSDLKTTDQGKKSSPQEEHQVEKSGQLLKPKCDKTLSMESSPPSLSVVKKCGQGNQTCPILIEDHKADSSCLSLKKSHDAHEQCMKSSSPLSKKHQVEQSSPYLKPDQDEPAIEGKMEIILIHVELNKVSCCVINVCPCINI